MLPPINNGPGSIRTLSQASRTELGSIKRLIQKPNEHPSNLSRRHLFQTPVLNTNQSIYKNIVQMVGQFINQVMGRDETTEPEERDDKKEQDPESLDDNLIGIKRRQVRGIADRLPWQTKHEQSISPYSGRDTVFLGDGIDYPGPVIALAYDDMIKPVAYEGDQLVARHLNLDIDKPSIEGQLILANGKRIPIDIRVFTAL